jgi:hypothetical protein
VGSVTTFKPGDRVHLAGDDTAQGPHVHVYKVVDILSQSATGNWGEADWAAIKDLTATGEPVQVVEIERLTRIDQ